MTNEVGVAFGKVWQLEGMYSYCQCSWSVSVQESEEWREREREIEREILITGYSRYWDKRQDMSREITFTRYATCSEVEPHLICQLHA